MPRFFESGHALLIGVGSDLPNTVNDAQGLADFLKDQDRCAYRPEQVELLTSEDADRAGILAGLDNMARRANEDSTALIYFSGHGYVVASSAINSYYLMPFGYNTSRLEETAISGQEFIDKLKATKAQKLLLLLDCCHAGGMTGMKAPGLRLTKSPMPPEAHDLLAQGRGHVVIASSKADESSYAGQPYSVFTSSLIEALCGKGVSLNDGFVRVADLALYARERVTSLTNGRQHPILNYEQADNFVLAYYAGGDTKLKSLPFTEMPEVREPELPSGREETDIRILKALSGFGRSYTPVFQALRGLGIEEVELGDRLDMLAESGYIQVLKGTYAPGMSLRNGINNVGITAKGRMFLRKNGML